jgi:hypothetical protein
MAQSVLLLHRWPTQPGERHGHTAAHHSDRSQCSSNRRRQLRHTTTDATARLYYNGCAS